jgi:hypothetical protein
VTTTRTAPPVADRSSSRAPWTLHLSAVPLALVAAVTVFGAVYFSTHPDPVRPDTAPPEGSWQALVFLVVLLSYAATALACVPALYRRSTRAWQVALGYLAAQVLFGATKYLGLGEDAALVFLVADLLIAVGLLAPATRAYVGAGPPDGGTP